MPLPDERTCIPLTQEAAALEDFTEYADLYARQKKLESELDAILARREELDPLLMNYLAENTIERMTVAGYTFSTQRVPWTYPAEGYSKEAVIAALKAAGLEHFIREEYSTSSLTGYVSELEKAHREELASGELENIGPVLPEPLRAVIRIVPKFNLRITPAKRPAVKKTAPRVSEEPDSTTF